MLSIKRLAGFVLRGEFESSHIRDGASKGIHSWLYGTHATRGPKHNFQWPHKEILTKFISII